MVKTELPNSREEAKRIGYKLYHTGKPCKRGHCAPRRVANCDCILCDQLKSAEWRENNKERKAIMDKKWQNRNRSKVRSIKDKWRRKNPDYNKLWHAKHPNYASEKAQRFKELNPEYDKQWHNNNAAHIRAYRRKYSKKRYRDDIQYKLSVRLRTRLGKCISRRFRSGSAVNDLGCSLDELKAHIENQFEDGMTWDNWGEWHIDHIMPLASFDLSDRDQFLEASHYTNLQPMWAEENIRKSDKLTDE